MFVRPSNEEVCFMLRKKRFQKSPLNDIILGNWTFKEFRLWEEIKKDTSLIEPQILKIRKPCSHTKRVLRIIDGFIFNSISECIRIERLNKTKMAELLLQKNKYVTI